MTLLFNIFPRRLYTTIVFFLLLPLLVLSQNTFSKKYSYQGDIYQINYEYIIKAKDTLPHGNYHLTTSKENERTKEIIFLDISGKMIEGQPHDNWRFRKGSLNPAGIQEIKDYAMSYNVKGTEMVASGVYTKGKKSGLWQVNEYSIENSKITDTLFTATLQFENNQFTNQLTIKDKKNKLECFFDETLFPIGIWKDTTWTGKKESWKFDNNSLVSINSTTKNESTTIHYINPNNNNLPSFEEINFSQNYIKLMDLISTQIGGDRIIKEGAFFNDNLLLKYETILNQINPLFSFINDVELPQNFKVQIPNYNLNQQDSLLLSQLSVQTKKLYDIIGSINNDLQIKSLKDKVTKLGEYHIILDTLTQKWVNPIDSLLKFHKTDLLKYFYVPKYLKRVYKRADDVNYVMLSIQNKYKTKNKLPNDENVTLSTLIALAKSLELEFLDIKSEMLATIKTLEKKESLVALEFALVKEYEELQGLIENINNDEINEIAGFYVHTKVKEFLENSLTYYLAIDDEDKKLEEVQLMHECYQELRFLILRIEEIPQDFVTIDNLYIKSIFNPYTFTNMDERISPAIFSAFQYTLLPSLMGKIKFMDCTNIRAHRREYDILFQGMVDWLKVKNKRTERYVKRLRDPQKIAQYLDIEIVY